MLTKESLKKFGSTAVQAVTSTISEPGPKDSAIAVFPRELREDRKDWPSVCFSTENQFVFLPIPPGLTFSDTIAYNTINLGILGPTLLDAVSKLTSVLSSNVDQMQVNAGLAAMDIYAGIKNRVLSGNAAAAASIAARKIPGVSEFADKIDYGNRQVLAPNTNSAFESPGIRNFSFTFKMVPKDKGDTEAIRNIVNFFRKYAYPEGNTIFLKYPPIWTIKFFNGSERNMYIPGIYGCYLTSVSSTYNAGTNLFHADGSPVEVDVALTFQETKVLTRAEIDKLNTGEGEV